MRIPKRWRVYVQAVADLAATSDPIVDDALRLLDSDRRSRVRVRAKSAPRREKAKATKEERRERTTTIREAVFARAAGRCECCLLASPEQLHHVLSGSNRRAFEATETCAAVCAKCHHDIHRNSLVALTNLWGLWAQRHKFSLAASAIAQRIDRLMRTP